MIKTEKREVVETIKTTREVVVSKTCDICAVQIKKPEDGDPVVTLNQISGYAWPEGDCRTVEEYDICSSCFDGAIREFMESHGAKVRERDADAFDSLTVKSQAKAY